MASRSDGPKRSIAGQYGKFMCSAVKANCCRVVLIRANASDQAASGRREGGGGYYHRLVSLGPVHNHIHHYRIITISSPITTTHKTQSAVTRGGRSGNALSLARRILPRDGTFPPNTTQSTATPLGNLNRNTQIPTMPNAPPQYSIPGTFKQTTYIRTWYSYLIGEIYTGTN